MGKRILWKVRQGKNVREMTADEEGKKLLGKMNDKERK